MDRQASFAEPSSATGGLTRNNDERAVHFRFAISWSSLFELLEPAKPTASLVPLDNRARNGKPEPEAAAPATTEEPPPIDRPAPAPGSDVNWEMVVPKMVRPSNRPSLSREAAPPPPTTPQYVVKGYQLPAMGNSPPEPKFAPSEETSSSRGLKFLLGLAALAALGGAVWFGAGSPPPKTVLFEPTLNDRNWTRLADYAAAASKLKRQLLLYNPSLNSSDGQIEFNWNVSAKSVGWVFRARDASNYHAMRLKILPGRSSALAAEHFTVLNGKESPHYEKMLALPEGDASLRVKMNVTGSEFTLYLQGAAEDSWTNAALSSGGFGFFEEHNQPADVQSVRIAFSEIPPSYFATTWQALSKSFQ